MFSDLENSPTHRPGSDLPLYDPPPSYEDVIKQYLPPPPPYSSISRGRIRNNRYQANGVENRAYRNDSPNTLHNQTRRIRSHQPRPLSLDHMILKVTLPEGNEPGATSVRDNVCDRNNYEHCASSAPGEASTSPEESQMQNNLSPENLNNSNMCQQSNVINESTSSLIPERTDNEPVQSCECQGACSCKLLNKKQFARCSSESRIMINNTNSNALCTGKVTLAKRSFTDIMQKGISKASSSAIIPHPASMTITVRPPKSKKTIKKGDSKSAGPSSPTTKTASDFDDNEIKQKSKFSHYRSSSGPDLSASLNSTSSLPEPSTSKCGSDNQILDASNLSQVKHLASVLFDGLQQSFNFRNEEPCCSNQAIDDDERIKPPVTWTNLLIPSRKKTSEQGETSIPKTRSWTACDTLPLLYSGSQPPAIVKFDDKNSSTFNSLDSTQNEDTSINGN